VSEDVHSRAQTIALDPVIERRSGGERRRLTFWTFLRSGFTPRRRCSRREGEGDNLVDWHEPHLLFLALTIVLLSVTDAFFTLTLLTNGAEEVNPVLAYVLRHFPKSFAVLKITLTGGGVLVLVAMARARVFKIVRVRTILQCVLAGYMALIAYQLWLMRAVL